METMLDLPTITGLPTDPVSTAIAAQVTKPTATLKETALASFAPIESHMRMLAARYKDVAYDVTTTKGMADAKAARLVLRDEGRYAVQRLVKRVKDEANDLKRVIDARGDEVIAITKDIEAAIDGQITAEETRKAAEKAERDRIERERVSALEQRLAGLSVWIERCKLAGITAERIRTGINMLVQAPIGDDWAEFKARAEARKAEVLDVMENLYAQALQREEEAARLVRLPLVRSRCAAPPGGRQRVLDAQAAEIKRQADELAAARAESERLERLAVENRALLQTQAAQLVLNAEPETADATDRADPADASPVGGPMGAWQPAAAGPDEAESDSTPPAVVEPATLKIGTICTRLGFTITAAFLHGKGIEPAGRDKAAALYRESQWPVIKAALIRHIEAA